jgi:hypothetical protein
VPAQCACGSLHDDELWRLVLPCEDSRYFVLFNGKSIFSLKQKSVGSRLVLRASTRPSRSPYCLGATPRVRLVMPSFSYVALIYRKQASITPLLDLPLVSIKTFLEGAMILPDSGQVGGSPSNYSALSSLQAHGLRPQELDVRLRTRSGGFF